MNLSMDIKTVYATVLLILLLSPPLFAEFVFLKDGSIIECRIENENRDSATARMQNGKLVTLSWESVIRIVYTEFYMGKVYVHKNDSSFFEAYLVDEDRTSYTFRTDLKKPEEFTVNRNEVQFISRKDPAGLKGSSDGDTIHLSWKAPFTQAKSYRIYIKTGNGKYSLYGETASTETIIKGVDTGKYYSIKVTALFADGYESLPSNEINISSGEKNPLRSVKSGEESSAFKYGRYRAAIQPGFYKSTGTFSKINAYGFGLLFAIALEDQFIRGLDLGAAAGYNYFNGNGSSVSYSSMVPLLLDAGYRFHLHNRTYLVPKIGAGFSFNTAVNSSGNRRTAFEPLALAGVSLEYDFDSKFFVKLGVDINVVLETKCPLYFITVNSAAGIRF